MSIKVNMSIQKATLLTYIKNGDDDIKTLAYLIKKSSISDVDKAMFLDIEKNDGRNLPYLLGFSGFICVNEPPDKLLSNRMYKDFYTLIKDYVDLPESEVPDEFINLQNAITHNESNADKIWIRINEITIVDKLKEYQEAIHVKDYIKAEDIVIKIKKKCNKFKNTGKFFKDIEEVIDVFYIIIKSK